MQSLFDTKNTSMPLNDLIIARLKSYSRHFSGFVYNTLDEWLVFAWTLLSCQIGNKVIYSWITFNYELQYQNRLNENHFNRWFASGSRQPHWSCWSAQPIVNVCDAFTFVATPCCYAPTGPVAWSGPRTISPGYRSISKTQSAWLASFERPAVQNFEG